MSKLLTPREIDQSLRYPHGRARRLAQKGLIPHIVLPDGEIRFNPDVIAKWLAELAHPAEENAIGKESAATVTAAGP